MRVFIDQRPDVAFVPRSAAELGQLLSECNAAVDVFSGVNGSSSSSRSECGRSWHVPQAVL